MHMPQVPLCITGELLQQRFQPPGPVVLHASKFNPGAEEVAQELQAMYPSVSHVDGPECLSSASAELLPSGSLAVPSTSQSMHADEGSNSSKRLTGAVAQQPTPIYFLLS